MTELPKGLKPKEVAKNSKHSLGTEESTISQLKTANNEHSQKSETPGKSNVDSSTMQSSHPLAHPIQRRVVVQESSKDKMQEFDVDVLYSWDQSSGTISYEVCSPRVNDIFSTAKMLPDYKGITCRAKLNQRLLYDSTPSHRILSVKSLTTINERMRTEQLQGHLCKRIVVPCKQNECTERYELISKICDDAINEYMTSSNRRNKLLEMKLECGGDMPPRLTVNGVHAERSIKYDGSNQGYYDISQIGQALYKTKHSFQHLSTCSPPVPYPSASTFGRCSIEDYVKQMKERRKKNGQKIKPSTFEFYRNV